MQHDPVTPLATTFFFFPVTSRLCLLLTSLAALVLQSTQSSQYCFILLVIDLRMTKVVLHLLFAWPLNCPGLCKTLKKILYGGSLKVHFKVSHKWLFQMFHLIHSTEPKKKVGVVGRDHLFNFYKVKF